MIQKRIKLFGERNHFSSTYSSGGVISCCKNPEQTFSTKVLTFIISKSEEGCTLCNFQKLLNLKIFERYVGFSFDNHASNFSLKMKVSVALKLEKNRLVFFFFWSKFFLTLLLETFFAVFSTLNLIFRCCHGNFTDNPKRLKCLQTCFKNVAVKVFLRTQWMWFWLPCQHFSAKFRSSSAQNLKIFRKKTFATENVSLNFALYA